jgi:anaerobic selenocysteine-containing dehydrogenase
LKNENTIIAGGLRPVITDGVIKSTCGLCGSMCGVLVTLENGRAVGIRGDPEIPQNKGALCPIGSASLEYLYHPERLKHPLRRTGQRGEGKWQQISWDEALSQIADELSKAKKNYGPEAVAMISGSAKGYRDTFLRRFANVFGTPNVACADYVCHVPRILASEITFGFFPGADYGYPPACIISWGNNIAETRFYAYKACVKALDRGAKLIVIDPLETELAKRADLWLQPRPGSDLALALGLINVIINEGLFDSDFVSDWTIGFDKLKTHVQDYPPERVGEITWVEAETIRKAARFYAINKPGRIDLGNALDTNLNSFQAARAISILMAIVGNLGAPGGEIESSGTGYREGEMESSGTGILGYYSAQLELRDKLPRDERQNRVGADLHLLPDYRYILPQRIVKSIIEGDPYPIRAAYVQGSNPLLSWPNTQETYMALKKLDFLAVADMFMTPTAAMADIVLPAASYLEFDGIAVLPTGSLAQVQRKAAQVAECRSDYEILNELAKELELEQYFWASIDGFWDAILEPVGLTFDDFKDIGRIAASRQYGKYKQVGFRTPSGKVELYSSQLEQWGLDPLPVYRELPETPYSDPELAKDYPLLCTSRKVAPYRHSGGREIPSLRRIHPEPVMIVNSETAGRLGIGDGDWVYVETKRSRVKQKATLSTSIDPRVVVVDYGWWLPERGEAELYGFTESNINMLTDNRPPFSREMGSANLRGISCRVYKAPKGETGA